MFVRKKRMKNRGRSWSKIVSSSINGSTIIRRKLLRLVLR